MNERKTLYEKIYFEIVPTTTSEAISMIEFSSCIKNDLYMVYEIFFDKEQITSTVLCGYANSRELSMMFQKEVRMTDDFDLHWINRENVFAIVNVGGKYFKSLNILKS